MKKFLALLLASQLCIPSFVARAVADDFGISKLSELMRTKMADQGYSLTDESGNAIELSDLNPTASKPLSVRVIMNSPAGQGRSLGMKITQKDDAVQIDLSANESAQAGGASLTTGRVTVRAGDLAEEKATLFQNTLKRVVATLENNSQDAKKKEGTGSGSGQRSNQGSMDLSLGIVYGVGAIALLGLATAAGFEAANHWSKSDPVYSIALGTVVAVLGFLAFFCIQASYEKLE